jgi:hypothetical protein
VDVCITSEYLSGLLRLGFHEDKVWSEKQDFESCYNRRNIWVDLPNFIAISCVSWLIRYQKQA